MLKWATTLLAVACACGCASVSVHEGAFMSDVVGRDPRRTSPSPIFGGVVTDVVGAGQSLAAPVRSLHDQYTDWYEIFIFPFAIIDIPFSLVADLIYLPSDIRFWPQWRAHRERTNCEPQDRGYSPCSARPSKPTP